MSDVNSIQGDLQVADARVGIVVGRFNSSIVDSLLVVLGVVIRGATPHFDYVAGECSKGLANVALQSGVPVGFGVLTTDTVEQAIERAGTKAGNKGVDAALSTVEMISLLRKLA